MMKHRLTVLACAAALTGLAGVRAADAPKPTPTLNPAERSKADDQYLIPSPADILSALDHAARIDWKELVAGIGQAETKTSYADDSKKALNLGLRVADAFVAVEAHDKEAFERASDGIAKLGQELSADSQLAARRDAARQLVEQGKWVELGNVLDQVRTDVLRALEAVPDEDSIILANLGGWLRGLDLVSGALSKNYSADGTRVLRQAGLVAYLKSRIDKLESPANSSKDVLLIKSKMSEIEALCTFDENATLPPEKVKRLHEITTELVQAIQK